MTGNRSQLINFVHKFMGTVRFGNDHITKIMGYGDYQMRNVMISRVYYVEGLGHNLFFVGQFCDFDLEVAFRKHTWFIRDLEEDLGKLKPKADIKFFVGYAPPKKAYQIYKKMTCIIIETIHIDFDELISMASKQFALGPRPQLLTPGTISSGLVSNPPYPTPYFPPTKKDWDILFQLMFDQYFNPSPSVVSLVPTIIAPEPADPAGTPFLTLIDQDAPSPSTSQTPQETQSLTIPFGVEENFHHIEVAHLDNDPFFGVSLPEPNFKESSSMDVIPTNVHSVNQPHEHPRK
nr:integrase, catalytic region, zinc finger, CCHC-type, peptidase aspartic, catalytic [Tanacetum cinerariifolium]